MTGSSATPRSPPAGDATKTKAPGDSDRPDQAWRGTARYEVVRSIGQGGMGVVYEAFDRERRQAVAVKTLLHFDPAALYRFKQEFRTLTGVVHPNLVHLYELVATGAEADQVFFAMELVRGVDFLAHTRREGATVHDADTDGSRDRPTARQRRDASIEGGARMGALPAEMARERLPSPADVDKLRPALLQLALGVHALHGAGKLHRDIKPSNVLVNGEGRVVLLDFGVATEMARAEGEGPADDEIVGTARYMAPEQGSGGVATPACDWYSVGVMLYEALVGHAPFVGPLFEVFALKNAFDPPSPRECVDGVPEDLDALCAALLARDPAARPDGDEILRQLGVTGEGPRLSQIPAAPAASEAPLIGREAHLAALREAFASVRSGRSVTVRVHGASGMGKSALVQSFLHGLTERGEAVVLRGRAYERESVPYKAVDSVIDALSRYLMRLTDRDDEPLSLPVDVWALARVFPVLRRVPKIGEVPEQSAGDPQRVRRRAFAALRELLGSLAKRKPLVLCVDDVQWGDTDSAALLVELVRAPYAPPLLLVMVHQDEAAASSAFLRETEARWPHGAESRNLAVGPLGAEDARSFAHALLEGAALGDESARRIATSIAREAGGSPFLLEELVRSVEEQPRAARTGDDPWSGAISLETVVSDRLALLPDDARRFLEIVAIGGRPLPVSTVADAAGSYDGTDAAIAMLCARRFVRAGFRDGRETVETCHDRIRDTIVSRLSPEATRKHHARLGRVLEATAGADPEALALHLLGAGENERAAEYAERAAEQAVSKLAFDQAARLFRLRLETIPAPPAEARRLQRRLAEVLEWSGRAGEAARAYLEASEGAAPAERASLQRAAAEQLLASGRIDEGTAVLRRVMASVGMEPPRTLLGAVMWLVLYRLWGRVRGLRFRERDEGEVSAEDRTRIDALYAGAMGFSLADSILGVSVQARHVLLALRRGDRLQVLRALAMEISHAAMPGLPPRRRERALSELVERLAAALGGPEAYAFVHGTRGLASFLRGRWKEARVELDLAQRTLTSQPQRAGWQSNTSLFAAHSLFYSGELRELARRQTRILAEAEQRRDLYMLVGVRVNTGAVMALVEDDPAAARKTVQHAMADWSRRGFLVQHWQAMRSEMDIEMYVGDGPAAYQRYAKDARALERSQLMRVGYIRVLTLYARGRAAVASIAGAPGVRAERVAEARGIARRLEGEGAPYAAAFAAIVAACAAGAAGDREAATSSLRAAIAASEASDMPLHAAAARRQLGRVVGGEVGAELVQRADDAMAAEGARAPERLVAMMVPGEWDAPPPSSSRMRAAR